MSKIERYLPLAAILLILILIGWRLYVLARISNESGTTTSRSVVAAVPLASGTWRFIVSGDSRNCGDIVMPAIAAHSSRYSPNFYWHLGDLRAIYKIDEDMKAESARNERTLTCDAYYRQAWPDFIEHQIAPFGSTRFYIGIGNHELIPPKNEDLFVAQFRDWLASPTLQAQRRKDKDAEPPTPPAYYHWVEGGVDFIYLDNASNSFSSQQIDWFDRRLAADRSSDDVRIVVAGMHEELPDSIASDHSMCDHPGDSASCSSGRHVYEALLSFRKEKPVYVLASHSHFYMPGVFDDLPPERRLESWIVGTGGAERYKLPDKAPAGSKTDVYGYMVATVSADRRSIRFEFEQIQASDVPAAVLDRYPSAAIAWCFAHNSRNIDPNAPETSHRCTPSAPAR